MCDLLYILQQSGKSQGVHEEVLAETLDRFGESTEGYVFQSPGLVNMLRMDRVRVVRRAFWRFIVLKI